MSAQQVDTIIVALLTLAALAGIWLGALRALTGLLSTGIVVLVMLVGYLPLARLLERASWLTPRAAIIVAFVVLAVLGQGLAVLLLQRPLRPINDLIRRRPGLRLVNALLGAVPGAVTGAILVGLVLVPLTIAAPRPALAGALRETRVATTLIEVVARLVQDARVNPLLRPATETFATTVPAQTGDEWRDLPFRVARADQETDPEDEAALLRLVNEERARAGLPPLALDPELAPVARAHAAEMFAQGYFAHDSPVTGGPFDRLAAAGITYLAAGENLAFAPDLVTAHQGLMNSPGHRANILSPAFGRAGIGIIRSRYHGLMVVQLFRN